MTPQTAEVIQLLPLRKFLTRRLLYFCQKTTREIFVCWRSRVGTTARAPQSNPVGAAPWRLPPEPHLDRFHHFWLWTAAELYLWKQTLFPSFTCFSVIFKQCFDTVWNLLEFGPQWYWIYSRNYLLDLSEIIYWIFLQYVTCL